MYTHITLRSDLQFLQLIQHSIGFLLTAEVAYKGVIWFPLSKLSSGYQKWLFSHNSVRNSFVWDNTIGGGVWWYNISLVF